MPSASNRRRFQRAPEPFDYQFPTASADTPVYAPTAYRKVIASLFALSPVFWWLLALAGIAGLCYLYAVSPSTGKIELAKAKAHFQQVEASLLFQLNTTQAQLDATQNKLQVHQSMGTKLTQAIRALDSYREEMDADDSLIQIIASLQSIEKELSTNLSTMKKDQTKETNKDKP